MQQKTTTCMILDPSEHVLLQLRDDGGEMEIAYPNTWVLPGGKVEAEESPDDTVVREIEEEFGIRTTKEQWTRLFMFEHDGQRDYVYGIRLNERPLIVLNEGADYAWKRPAELEELELGFDQNRIWEGAYNVMKTYSPKG